MIDQRVAKLAQHGSKDAGPVASLALRAMNLG
jgi:hypothetical protein